MFRVVLSGLDERMAVQNKKSLTEEKSTKRLTFEEKQNLCQEFIRKFEDYTIEETHENYSMYGKRKYLIQMQKISNGESQIIEIHFQDIENYFCKDQYKQILQECRNNTLHYINIFNKIIDHLMPKKNNCQMDILEKFQNVLKQQRKQNFQACNALRSQNQNIPLKTFKNYDTVIIYCQNQKQDIKCISELNSKQIGSLISCKGIVIKTYQVKPQLLIATYACDNCGCQNYLQIMNENFKPLKICTSKKCQQNQIGGKLTFLPGHSKFQSTQQIKIQQTQDQLKPGQLPKVILLVLKNSLIQNIITGDIVYLQGILLPKKKEGIFHQYDLIFDEYIQIFKIKLEKKKYQSRIISKEIKSKIQQIRNNNYNNNLNSNYLFNKLSQSICPQIYGMQTVKKAILLQLVGGISIETEDCMSIRGQINIALIGDPGIAKSQILKYVSHLAPRGIYTTGKGTSGVGLTASIRINPNTKQSNLQAGALVLADMGICCIDQFDKMKESDRTAIHEVMQQQSISIAKAGITACLNARVSILAALNPYYGRYNSKQTLDRNINLPSALLSRFDIIFILLDQINFEKDKQIAQHIGQVHKNGKIPIKDIFDIQFLRSYIIECKKFKPTLSKQLHQEIINKYISMRIEEVNNKEDHYYTTHRSLLALIRFCQARAKLRHSNTVSHNDVKDCLEIIEESHKNLMKDQLRIPKKDNCSCIYTIVKDMCFYSIENKVRIELIETRALAHGFTDNDIQKTLKLYETMNVLMIEGGFVRVLE